MKVPHGTYVNTRYEILTLWPKPIHSVYYDLFIEILGNAETNSELCQTSKIEHFAKIVNGYNALNTFPKRFILDVLEVLFSLI